MFYHAKHGSITPSGLFYHCLFFISSSIILNKSAFDLNAHSFKYLSRYLNFNCALSSFADCCFQKSMSSDLLTLTPLITASSSAPADLALALASALALAFGVGLDLDLALAPNSSIFLRLLIFLPLFPVI